MKTEFNDELEKFFGSLFGKPTIINCDKVIDKAKKHKNNPFNDMLSGHQNSENDRKVSTDSCEHDHKET